MKLSPSLSLILLILAVLNIFAFVAFQTPSFLFLRRRVSDRVTGCARHREKTGMTGVMQ